MKSKKRKKSSRAHGRKMGTHGWGARKKHKKSGHRGGKGMAGSGKRGDQKKTLVIKKYGNKYFGRRGVTSKKTEKKKVQKINLRNIELNLETFLKKGIAKKVGEGFELDLKNHKILGEGDIKNKSTVKAKSASKSAIEKIKKAGGNIEFVSKLDKQEKPEEKEEES